MKWNRQRFMLVILSLAGVFNLLFPPYFAVRSDEPTVLHTSLGVWPIWSRPEAHDAFDGLKRRFPERITGTSHSLPVYELERLYLVRLNRVRYCLHWFTFLLLIGGWIVLWRRKRFSSG